MKKSRIWAGVKPGYLLLTCLVLLFIPLGGVSPASAQSTPPNIDTTYLSEMPEVQRVLQDMQGKDELDTLARQFGALEVLAHVLKERTVGRIYNNALTKEEEKVLGGYQGEAARLTRDAMAIRDRDGSGCRNGNPDDPECVMNKFRRYAGTGREQFQPELFNRYFSKQWQEGYQRDVTTLDERHKRIQAARDEALQDERKGKSVDSSKTPSSEKSVADRAIALLVWALLGWGIWRFATAGRRRRKKNAKAQAEAKRPDGEAWKRLGATPEEREATIKRLFDAKQGSLSYGTIWFFEGKKPREGEKQEPWTYRHSWIRFRISRSLAVMDPREREFLRMVYLLFNAKQISFDEFEFYRFCFINGNGKGTVDSCAYFVSEEETGIKSAPSAVRYFQDKADASVDSAVNKLLGTLEKLGQGDDGSSIIKEIKSRIHGGGAWLAPEEVPSTLFSDKGAYAVRLGMLDGSQAPLTYGGEGSLITIAPPGSGKTQCFVLPTMLSWPGPAVVLDVKGEIYANTSKWRAQHVGPIFKFSPLDPANSKSYNPLTFIRQDPEFLWEDARFLADMMIVPSGASDPFWENTARDVLTSAIAYLCYLNQPDQRPIAKLIDLIYGMGWDDMVMVLKTNMAVSAMRQMGHSLSEMEKKTRDSVLKTAQSSLSAWQGERINRVTKESDWNPLDLRTSKSTVYICINPNEIDSYLSILRVLIAQHVRMLTSQLPPREAAPVLFVLDELPRLKKMPPIDEALNIGRQYGIRLWLFAQSYGQLRESYSNPEGMLGSCTVRTFMNVPLNDELAQKLSDQLGYREGPLDASRTKLVEPIELAGPHYKDLILVLATNTKPARVRKAFAYQDPDLQTKMGSP